MGIILGIDWPWDISYDKTARRALGYLLHELAGLATWAQMQERLEKLATRRKTLAKTPGMKDQPPPLQPEVIDGQLTELWNSIQTADHEKKLTSRRNFLQAQGYTPPTTVEARLAFLKYVLRSKAETLIAESGE